MVKRTHKKKIKKSQSSKRSSKKKTSKRISKNKYHLVIIHKNGVKHYVYVMLDKFHGKSNKKYDVHLKALPPGKRKSVATGRWYYETRARHSDKFRKLKL